MYKNQPLKSTMKVIIAKRQGLSSVLEQREVKIPEIKDSEVLIKVCAVGVNRVDIIDLTTSVDGFCPGHECSGTIEAVGRNVNCWKVGERVCAILEGGGCAEKVAVPADFLLPLPDDIDLDAAAGLPYASCCIWLALFKMHTPETFEDKEILIHESSDGISPLAIQYAKYMGLTVIASTGNRDIFKAYGYGADICVDSTPRMFLRRVGYVGVDFVLDYGASNLERNIEYCCTGGKVAILDLNEVKCSMINLGILQMKHAEIKVFRVLSRDFWYKASVVAGLKTHLWPAILQGKVVPKIEHFFPASATQEAFNLLMENESTGKIIVRMDFEKASRHLKMNFEKASPHLKMQ